MAVESHRFSVQTQGDSQVVDLTGHVQRCLDAGRVRNGLVTVFVVGSTAAISTTEYEPGLVQRDLKAAYERVAPQDAYYQHEQTWHDDNGHAHVRATVTGPSLTIPLVDGHMTLGTWQQVVLMDFDTRPRRRQILVQVVGE